MLNAAKRIAKQNLSIFVVVFVVFVFASFSISRIKYAFCSVLSDIMLDLQWGRLVLLIEVASAVVEALTVENCACMHVRVHFS